MTTITASEDLKSLKVVQGETEQDLRTNGVNNNVELISTSNGSLIRIIKDSGRIEFNPIILNDGNVIPGSFKDKTSDVLEFKKIQAWIVLSHFADKFIA